jgi:hypothetical protein
MSDETPETAVAAAELAISPSRCRWSPNSTKPARSWWRSSSTSRSGQDGTVITAVPGLQVFCISKPDGPKHALRHAGAGPHCAGLQAHHRGRRHLRVRPDALPGHLGRPAGVRPGVRHQRERALPGRAAGAGGGRDRRAHRRREAARQGQRAGIARHVRQPHRHARAGAGAAPAAAARHARRRAHRRAAHQARNPVPPAGERRRRAAAPDRPAGQPHPAHHQGHQRAARQLRAVAAGGGHGARGAHERVVVPPPLQGRDRHEPAAVPEAAAPAGGAPPDAAHGGRRGLGRAQRGLRKPLAVRARVRPHVRRAAAARQARWLGEAGNDALGAASMEAA